MKCTAQLINTIYFSILVLSLSAQNVLRGPYLQSGTENSMIIKWRTDVAADSKVWFGTNPSSLDQIVAMEGKRTDHQVLIERLIPNTRYYYAIGTNTAQLAGADIKHYFVTAPPKGSEQTVRGWVLGDFGWGNEPQRAVRDGYYEFIGDKHTDMVLLLGDNAYPDGTDRDYQSGMFENMYEDKLINSVWWPSPGNHDITSSDSDTQSGPYYDIFTCPTRGEAGGVPSGTEAYYSFDYANIHVISLDSDDSPRSPDGAMAQWLQKDLQANQQKWTIAFWHHPPYASPSGDSSSIHSNMRENFASLLEDYGVDLVLAGHIHRYQRSFLINGHYGYAHDFDAKEHGINMGDGRINGDGAYQKILTGPDAGKGTVYIIAGSAGDVHINRVPHPVFYYNVADLGSLYFEVTGNQMDVKFIDVNARVNDYFTIFKQNGTGSPPVVSITNPGDERYYTSPRSITIEASANDSDGMIKHVNFLVNGALVEIDDAPPYSLNWNIPSDGSYEIFALAEDNDKNLAISSAVNIRVGKITFCSTINSSSDDAEERFGGNVLLDQPNLGLINDSWDQTVGLRFTNLNIPPAAPITGAYLQFTTNKPDNFNPCTLKIYGEATSHSTTFRERIGDVTMRTRTKASAVWSPPDWLFIGERGMTQRSVDITPIIQEIVNMEEFDANSAIGLIIDGVGGRSAMAFDRSPSRAPELCVEVDINQSFDQEPITRLKLFPNPALGDLTASFFSNSEGNIQVQIINSFGQVVLWDEREVFKGSNKYELVNVNLAGGVYFLKLNLDNFSQVSRFILLNEN